jgi:uncharacterized protein (TIGR01777 family)
MKKNVLITGGTGFVGKHLTALLLEKGYSVSVFSREKRGNTADVSYYTWNVSRGDIEEAAVLNADYIIHLAGENIAGSRWSKLRKSKIIDSRTESAELIYSILKKYNKKIDVFVSASGIGIYGAINGEDVCLEDFPAATDFLGSTCFQWEKSVDLMNKLGVRTVKIRTGLVLGKNEGFLKRIIPIFKLGLGAVLGNGKQYMPWVHIDDLCSIYVEAIENHKMQGSYNAVINDGTTNIMFSKTLAAIYGHSIWLPNLPSLLLKLLMGEMAVIVLKGRRVSSDKISKTGFNFKYKNLEKALRNCLNK